MHRNVEIRPFCESIPHVYAHANIHFPLISYHPKTLINDIWQLHQD